MTTRTAAEPEAIEAQVRRVYASLSVTERRLADAVLGHRDALLGLSATELAALAGASKASAARFFKRLGYADFQAFRAQVRSQASVAPLHRLARTRSKQGLQAQLHEHALYDQQCLQGLASALDDAALDEAVALLTQARRVWVLGYRNAHAVAAYALALLHQVRPQVAWLNDAAGRESELLADLDASDVVLVVDLRRRTRHLPEMMRAVHDRGARQILLSDAQASVLEPLAQSVLRCPTHSHQVFDSYVPAISLVNFLASAVTARSGRVARARLSRIEQLHLSLDDLEGSTR